MKKRAKQIVIGSALLIALVIVVGFVFMRPTGFLKKILMRDKKTVASVVETHEKSVLNKLKPTFDKTGIQYEDLQIAILAFKEEKKLSVYARNTKSAPWLKFKDYNFTAFSGKIGPKLKEGDRQIPEGVYKVESLNPNSSYHLSLRVNYPNDFDRTKGEIEGREKLGGDIMIHGRAVTIGCIPIRDENIEELFVLAAKSYKAGIPVIIAPTDFRNVTKAPVFDEIEWEDELYATIKKELEKFN